MAQDHMEDANPTMEVHAQVNISQLQEAFVDGLQHMSEVTHLLKTFLGQCVNTHATSKGQQNPFKNISHIIELNGTPSNAATSTTSSTFGHSAPHHKLQTHARSDADAQE